MEKEKKTVSKIGESRSSTTSGSKKRFEQRFKAIRKWYTKWLDFEKPLRENEPKYLNMLYEMANEISEVYKKGSGQNGHRILWNEARNRVMTIEKLNELSFRFEKDRKVINGDIARIANNNRNMYSVNVMRKEAYIMNAVIESLRPVYQPQSLKTNVYIPKTDRFCFMADIDRQYHTAERPLARKPRKKWRVEIGI